MPTADTRRVNTTPSWSPSRTLTQEIADQVQATRKKDFESPFRRMVYETDEEMAAVLGTIEDNSFVKETREATQRFIARVAAIRERG